MVGEEIEKIIQKKVNEILTTSKMADMSVDLIETDSIAEVIEKLSILHCRLWYLEDSISSASDDLEIADLKKKIDICFKIKRPKYVQAINRMIEKSVISGKSLIEDSVKIYKGFNE
jgi:2-phosphoglycerate kinase